MCKNHKTAERIYRIASGKGKIKKFVTPAGGLFFLTVVSGLLLLSLYVDSLFNLPIFLPNPLNIFLGALFLIPGIFLSLYCVLLFLLNKGTPVPLNPPPSLIVKGPYKYIRNPMISGLILQFFGFGLFCNSITLAFITTPFLFLVNYLELRFIEEPELEIRLGNSYKDYKKNTPMFFPRLVSKK